MFEKVIIWTVALPLSILCLMGMEIAIKGVIVTHGFTVEGAAVGLALVQVIGFGTHFIGRNMVDGACRALSIERAR